MTDLILGFWPLWYPVAAAAGLFVASRFSRWYRRKLTRARRCLSERDARLACRPAPAPIDVEPMR